MNNLQQKEIEMMKELIADEITDEMTEDDIQETAQNIVNNLTQTTVAESYGAQPSWKNWGYWLDEGFEDITAWTDEALKHEGLRVFDKCGGAPKTSDLIKAGMYEKNQALAFEAVERILNERAEK